MTRHKKEPATAAAVNRLQDDPVGQGINHHDSETGRTAQLPVSRIKDPGAQMREEMRPDTVNEYAEAMLEGATFPPVVVYQDGGDYWLADGYHRVDAARKIERETIAAEIREGTARDAVLAGAGANATHGLRRTQADKRRAVERLLADAEWAGWSDRKIAKAAKVSHPTVAKVRAELSGEIPTPKPQSGKITTASGMPNEPASLLGDLLRTVADDLLIAECKRRGLTMEAADA